MACIIKGTKRSTKKHPYFKSNMTRNPRLEVIKGKHFVAINLS